MNAYATINNMQGISRNTGYLLGNIDVGIWEFAGTGYCVNDVMHQSSHS